MLENIIIKNEEKENKTRISLAQYKARNESVMST